MSRFFFIALLTLSLTSGCVSFHELADDVVKARKAGNEGVIKTYPVDTNQAWDITLAVFRWEKTDEIEQHRDENYVITSTGMKMIAYGSVMGVWIEPEDSGSTRITVITKRRVQSDPFTRLTPATFYERFEQGVKIIKSGGELPVTPPVK